MINAVLWSMNLDVPAQADVRFVDPFEPTDYAFNGFRHGVRPSDHALGKPVPQGNGIPATPLPKKQ